MPKLITFEMGIHYIDVMRFFFGEITSVYALHRKINPIIAGEDMAHITLQHNFGEICKLDMNWCMPVKEEPAKIRVEGDRGVIEVLPDSRTIQTVNLDGKASPHVYEYPAGKGGALPHAFVGCLGDFANSLASGKEFESSGRDNVKSFAATMACYESAESGQVVRMPS